MPRRIRSTTGGLLEAPFQQQVVHFADICGWYAYHPPDNRPITTRSGRERRQRVKAGYPDLTLVHPIARQLIFAELKTDTGRVSADQQVWLDALALVAEVHVWRPRDWDAIQARLERAAERT